MKYKCKRCKAGWRAGELCCWCEAPRSYRVPVEGSLKVNKTEKDIFTVFVDRFITRKEQIQRCGIVTKVNSSINGKNFPIHGRGIKKIKVKFFMLQEETIGLGVPKRMEMQNLRPATLSEFLCFVEQYPEECCMKRGLILAPIVAPIVVLGSRWGNNSVEFVVYGWYDEPIGEYKLDIENLRNAYYGKRTRFLAVEE